MWDGLQGRIPEVFTRTEEHGSKLKPTRNGQTQVNSTNEGLMNINQSNNGNKSMCEVMKHEVN